MIDEKLLLNILLNVSDEENDVLEWCFSTLDEQQIASCLDQAKKTAATEIRADDPATLLTSLFVKIIVRCLRWTRLERQRERSKIAVEQASKDGPLQSCPVNENGQ
jgi:hypothetical protein